MIEEVLQILLVRTERLNKIFSSYDIPIFIVTLLQAILYFEAY